MQQGALLRVKVLASAVAMGLCGYTDEKVEVD